MKYVLTIAAVALAITGTAAAGKVLISSSAQIKDGTIQLRDLSPAARVALRAGRKIELADLSVAVRYELRNPPPSGIDPAKISVTLGPSVDLPELGASGSSDAVCPAGSRAISGGFITGAAVVTTGPSPSNPAAWHVAAVATFYAPTTLRAIAVCARP